MTGKIEPITLDEYVRIVRHERGLVIYDRTHEHDSFKGNNDCTLWTTVGRDASFYLAKIGVPNIKVE
jgi:hypothetical protein